MTTIKLIACDMDGTLLNANRELPPDFVRILKKIRKQGITFVVASGRQYANLLETFNYEK
ncbi:MAG: HAD hydrolase family protein, partial [Oligoflexia bacterium]|nr:HAD hydrolase family protein [Oligoflexia bacterium]